MKPVNQVIVDKGLGDCMRATVASLLELPLEAVPHFLLIPKHLQWYTLMKFFESQGYIYEGVSNYSRDPNIRDNILNINDSFNGFFYACVPSRVFDNCTHAVIMDMNGVIVHDPGISKHYQGENVLFTGNINYWLRVSQRKDEEWLSWNRGLK